MNASTMTATAPLHSTSCSRTLRKRRNCEARPGTMKFAGGSCYQRNTSFVSLKSVPGSRSSPELNARNSSSAAAMIETATMTTPLEAVEIDGVADRLRRLVLEFKSLEEPIERVKRLLHYAASLPAYDESCRVPENRVEGCATQVWLEAEMDELGRMRFRADSDSEISKGFCWCLIWMLDGGEPEEVLGLKTEDLEHVNVGLYVKANSRVNTWHNVLLTMQKKTKALVAAKSAEGNKPPPWEPLASSMLLSPADEFNSKT